MNVSINDVFVYKTDSYLYFDRVLEIVNGHSDMYKINTFRIEIDYLFNMDYNTFNKFLIKNSLFNFEENQIKIASNIDSDIKMFNVVESYFTNRVFL